MTGCGDYDYPSQQSSHGSTVPHLHCTAKVDPMGIDTKTCEASLSVSFFLACALVFYDADHHYLCLLVSYL